MNFDTYVSIVAQCRAKVSELKTALAEAEAAFRAAHEEEYAQLEEW